MAPDRARGTTLEKQRRHREELFGEAAELTPLIGVDTAEGRFVVSTGDHGVGRRLFVAQRRGEMKTLERAIEILAAKGLLSLPQQNAFIDVGANVGTSCIPALLRHRFATAIACEPHPANFRLLRVNAAINGVTSRIDMRQIAVSDHAGSVSLLVDRENSGAHRVAAANRGESEEMIEVRCETLDVVIGSRPAGAPAPGLLWIDAQGHEGSILAGATELLATRVPIVLELWPTGLADAGGAEPLVQGLADTHGSAIDLRQKGPSPAPFPLEEIPSLAESLGEAITDLLILPE